MSPLLRKILICLIGGLFATITTSATARQNPGAQSGGGRSTALQLEERAVALWGRRDCAAMPIFRDLAQGNATPDAAGNYGLALADGRCGTNYSGAAPYLQRCINRVSDSTQYCLNLLGVMYANGQGVSFDEHRGEDLLRRAAGMGNTEARTNLQMLLQARAAFGAGGDGGVGRGGRAAVLPSSPREPSRPARVLNCYWVPGTNGFPGHQQCS